MSPTKIILILKFQAFKNQSSNEKGWFVEALNCKQRAPQNTTSCRWSQRLYKRRSARRSIPYWRRLRTGKFWGEGRCGGRPCTGRSWRRHLPAAGSKAWRGNSRYRLLDGSRRRKEPFRSRTCRVLGMLSLLPLLQFITLICCFR